MSDDSKTERVAQQDEPGDEVEGHSKASTPNAADEGNDDEVEGHMKAASPKND